MKNKIKSALFSLILLLFAFPIISQNFKAVEFLPIINENFINKNNVIEIETDLSDAVLNGVEIPSTNQSKNGCFAFKFKVTKKRVTKERLYYRLYYQNRSYKFNETSALCDENFYGSWGNDIDSFKLLPEFSNEITIVDSFRINGNPRNELLYYGKSNKLDIINDVELKNTIAYIKENKSWYDQIKEKAQKEGRTETEQLRLDAEWSIREKYKPDSLINNRSWRNPRMGEYEFILVVITESLLNKIPTAAKKISVKGEKEKFINPFQYYTSKYKTDSVNLIVLKSKIILKTKSKFNLGSGIFIDRKLANTPLNKTNNYDRSCGESYQLFNKAHFKQYFHYINTSYPLKNIKSVLDVMDTSFTQSAYNDLNAYSKKNDLYVETIVSNSDCPCKTVHSDSLKNSITILNPGNDSGEYKKEQVGIMGRIGFTYGKWRAKIKFPELINKNYVWNGITAAFWLLSEETKSKWNARRECNATVGYIPKYEPDIEASLKKANKTDSYSEIDFEILKESQFWPMTSYPGKINGPKDDPAKNNDITITCTNWDLACQEPKYFGSGAQKNMIDGKEVTTHRWNPWYKALTTKVSVNHHDVFESEFYYFEIEWLPTKIIWRIGPAKDKMRIICIMDNTVSAIPNNQMIAMVTQEWHHQDWWPLSPFKQNELPFPKKDIIGKILEIEVE